MKPKENIHRAIVGSLSNGMELVMLPRAAPGWSASLQILSGSTAESAEEAGIAHLTEHVTLMGTRPPTGLDINASTDFHETVFEATDHHSLASFQKGVQFLNECVFQPVLSEATLQKEKQVVKMEALQTDTPEYRVDCEILKFLDSKDKSVSLNRFPIGSMDIVQNLKLTQVKDFHAKNYIPRNARLFISADMSNVDMIKTIENAFQVSFTSLPNLVPRAKAGAAESGSDPEIHILDGKSIGVASPLLCLVHREPLEPDNAEFHVTTKVALSILNGRLKKLANEFPVQVEASSVDSAREGAHVVRIIAKVSEQAVTRVLQRIVDALHVQVNPEELYKACEALKQDLAEVHPVTDLTAIIDATTCGHKPRTPSESAKELLAALQSQATAESISAYLHKLASHLSLLTNVEAEKQTLEQSLLQRDDIAIARSTDNSDFRFSWRSAGRIRSEFSAAASTLAQLAVNAEIAASEIEAMLIVGLDEAAVVSASVPDFIKVIKLVDKLEITQDKLSLLKEHLKLFLQDQTIERKAADSLFKNMFSADVAPKLCEPSYSEIDSITTADVLAALKELQLTGPLNVLVPEGTPLREIRAIPRITNVADHKDLEIFSATGSETVMAFTSAGDVSGKALVLVGGALKCAIDRTAVSANLLSELRDKRSLVYDVQVNETSVEGHKSFVVVSAHTHRDSADQVKQIVREVLEGKLEAVHVTVAI